MLHPNRSHVIFPFIIILIHCILSTTLSFSLPQWFTNQKIEQVQRITLQNVDLKRLSLSKIREAKQSDTDPSLMVGSWLKSSAQSLLYDEFLLEHSFENAYIPEYYINVDARIYDYRLYYPLIGSDSILMSSLFVLYDNLLLQNFTCKKLFCPLDGEKAHPLAQQYSTNTFSNNEDKLIYELVMSFCYYSGNVLHNVLSYERDDSGLTQFEAFALAMNATYGDKNNINGPCKNYTIPFYREPCNGGWPFPYPGTPHPGSTYGQACYCPDTNRYGFRCDGYTNFLFPFRYEVLNYLLLVPIVFSILICLLLVNIPHFSSRIVNWIALRHTAPDTMTRKFFTMFLDLKTPCHIFTLLACLFLIPEQLVSIPTVQNYVKAQTEVARGVFVFLSFACMSFGFVSILILWSHICHQSVTRSSKLSVGNIIMMVVLYSVIILIAVAFTLGISIAGGTDKAAIGQLWPIYQSLTGLFFGVLIIGFFIYGIYMYVILKRVAKHMNRKVSFSSLKFTRFMFVADMWFLVIVLFLLTIVLSWIRWDMLSIVHYLITPPVVTLLVLVECYIMLYILFDRDSIIDGYLCCASKALRNKWKKIQEFSEEQEPVSSPSKETSDSQENQTPADDFGGFQLPDAPKKKKNIMDELDAYDKQFGESYVPTSPQSLANIEMQAISVTIPASNHLEASSPTIQVPIEYYGDE